MNDQIAKLYDQAIVLEGNGDYVAGELDPVKFAQLIVGECADIAYKTSWDDLVHGYGQAVIPLHLHNTIKQHFGVAV